MRDPKRIPNITRNIEKIWSARPDLRLWQVMALLESKYKELYPHSIGPQLFFVEDDAWQIVIDAILKEEVKYIHPISQTPKM